MVKAKEVLSRLTLLRSVQEVKRAASTLETKEALCFIESVATAIVFCFEQKRKVLIAGNGGSLCDAMHFAEELTGQFRKKRPALPALALSDAAHLSCVSNDMGFEEVFARGIEALGCSGDVFIALSTSGNSQNLIRGVKRAQKQGLTTVAFLGKSGGVMKGLCDLEWIVEGFAYSDRVQEAHMAALHIITELVEKWLFGSE